MHTLDDFQHQLEKAIGRSATSRPFVCEGSPLDCGVFIVGFNPATDMSADFWKFWTPGYGFDKAAWFDAYKAESLNKPLRPGKTRRTAVSPTRRVIEWICEAASPVRCLESNIYSTATPDMNSLGHEDRDAAIFRFLVETIKPSVIVAHGKDAGREADRFSGRAKILAVPHFSRGLSEKKARELGAEIRLLAA
ncbi:hypothetical protein [Terricaulis sp.]|uniref:hypothetical protein n=1 Tax=Terricaulis sp. TaxID=2768686 RepID=UPI002AC7694F|nr:hypothetical protein [Terricaulis sp.]MDZ4689710.1 hypothetical protein [Terricaulis sp.]